MYGAAYGKIVEKFSSSGDSGLGLLGLLLVIAMVVVQLFIVRWLWNTVLTRVVSIAKPIPNLWYALGLLVLMAMIHPGYAVAATA
jgi:hypothetical protein